LDIKEIVYDSVHWINMAQYRDQWRSLVNLVKDTLGSINGGEFLE
jgi:hypothetical protein